MYLGIDLGSTNTTAAVHMDGRVQMIEMNASGALTMPSVICIAPSEEPTPEEPYEVIVGHKAVEKGKLYPDFDFRNFKRKLGVRWNPHEDMGFQTTEGAGGMLAYRGPDGHTYSPVELASYMIGAVIRAANTFLAPHDSVTGVVLGVPATFDPQQVEAVKEAARLAGVVNVFTLEEPVAAALATGAVNKRKMLRPFVVDFGGGTLDTADLKLGRDRAEVVAKNGVADLGGVDFDKLIADFVLNLWMTEHKKDLRLKDAAMSRIMVEAEAVKKRLSDDEKTTFRLDNIDRTPDGISLHMIYDIDRRIFNEMAGKLLDRMIAACQHTLDDAKAKDAAFSPRLFDEILLVGGMTRVPIVRDRIAEFFGREPKRDAAPEFIVAQGCAIKAAILEGRMTDILVADITGHDIAVETVNNVPAVVIPRGTPYPLEKPITLANADDDQTEISVRLLYATRTRAQDCLVLQAEDIPIEPAPAETVRVRMVVAVNDEGQPTISRVA
jgi:molecular chaperone DnaK